MSVVQALSSAAAQDFQNNPYAAAMPKPKDRPEFSRRLVALRQAAGLSQLQLAERVGTNASNVAFWELTGTPPRGEVLPAMARALGVSIDELLGVTPPKPKRAVAKGQLQEAFESASKLPRRQQQKLAEFVRVFVTQHADAA